ncbi:MAG: recombinase family protein [Anaerolineae bacterium]|nr:recombinase family protein [Anaerolineae bacterium]
MPAKRVALYARVSTDVQAEKGYSLDAQMDALRLDAATNAQQIVDEFRDDYTGRTLNRPDWQRLMRLAETRKLDEVVIFSVDRASRTAFDVLKLIADLKVYGVSVRFLDFEYEDNPLGRLLLYIKGFTAESEADQFKERSKRGKRGRVAKGQPLPSIAVPYGYKYVSQRQADGKKGGQWEIYESEAAIVRRIFRMYVVDRLGTIAIANKLTLEGIPNRSNTSGTANMNRRIRTGWSQQTVLAIVSNEAYTGTAYYGKTRREGRRNPETGKEYTAKVQQPRDLWQPFAVPAIIEKDVFEAAQRLRKTNSKVGQRNVPIDYWLRGKVRCTCCGYLMHAFTRWRDKVRIYQCPGQTRHNTPDGLAPTCRFTVFAADLESRVLDAMIERLSHPAEIIREYLSSHEHQHLERQRITAALNLQRKEAAGYKALLSRMLDNVLVTDFPSEIISDKVKHTTQLLKDTEAEIADLEKQLGGIEEIGEVPDLTQFFRQIARKLRTGNAVERRIMADKLGIEVALNRDNAAKTYTATITYKVDPAVHIEPLTPDAEMIATDRITEQSFAAKPYSDPDGDFETDAYSCVRFRQETTPAQ